MKKGIKITLITLVVVIVVASAGLLYVTRIKGIERVYKPIESRTLITELPNDYGMFYEHVSVTTADGLIHEGWFVPSENSGVIIAQHGYRDGRNNMLYDAANEPKEL